MFLKGKRDEQSTYQAKGIYIESKDVKDAETNIIATQQGQKTEQQTCRNYARKYPHDGRCPATGKCAIIVENLITLLMNAQYSEETCKKT